MPDPCELLDPVGYALLSRALADCEAYAVTGGLRVLGRPGGLFRLARGRVVAVESPGAPGPEVLLRAGWPSDRTGDRPGDRRLVEALATRDAVFAVLAGEVGDCVMDAGGGATATGGVTVAVPSGRGTVAVPCGRGEEPGPLLREAVGKLTALAALPYAVLPHRDRPVRAPAGTGLAVGPCPAERREILRLADGRRTPRDIAFLLGRGVHAVTVETALMLGEGLLLRAVAKPRGSAGPGSRTAAPPLYRRQPGGEALPVETGRSPGLPRRSPGASGRTRTPAVDDPAVGWRGFFRGGERPRAPVCENKGGPLNGP
ncbi:MarR family transcriptional regulator [Streptomyces sp. NPDC041068]|uniref:MarR family transcriptional regulator n=1 Tax=Streptomyces sp. NPDC041068 TaxID=3155130 RepID=UPI0033EB2C30